MAELTVRLVFSLAVVLGLLMLCVRLAGRRFQGRHDAMVQVVHRQAISRSASVSVVNVAGRVLVLGTTEHGIRLLTELDPDEADEATDPAALALVTPIAGAEDAGPERMDVPAADVLLREEKSQQVEPARPGRHVSPRGSRANRGGGGRTAPEQQGTLSGSLLSVQTWRQALGAVTGRAS